MLRTSGTLHKKPDRTIFHPDSLHLMQRQTAERADPAGQIIQLGIDLFLALEQISLSFAASRSLSEAHCRAAASLLCAASKQ